MTTHMITLCGLSFSLVTRVRSQGRVRVKVNVVTKDMWKHGFRNGMAEPSLVVNTSAKTPDQEPS